MTITTPEGAQDLPRHILVGVKVGRINGIFQAHAENTFWHYTIDKGGILTLTDANHPDAGDVSIPVGKLSEIYVLGTIVLLNFTTKCVRYERDVSTRGLPQTQSSWTIKLNDGAKTKELAKLLLALARLLQG